MHAVRLEATSMCRCIWMWAMLLCLRVISGLGGATGLKVVDSNDLPQRKQTLSLKKNQTLHSMRCWLGMLCSPAGCFGSFEKRWVATPRGF